MEKKCPVPFPYEGLCFPRHLSSGLQKREQGRKYTEHYIPGMGANTLLLTAWKVQEETGDFIFAFNARRIEISWYFRRIRGDTAQCAGEKRGNIKERQEENRGEGCR